MNFKKILFPVDFSERTAKAAPHVRAMADRFQAEIVALHVVHYPIAYYGTPEGTYLAEIDTNRLMDNARQVLTAFVADAFPGRNVKQLVEEGDPGTMVAHVAEREAVDLVMLGGLIQGRRAGERGAWFWADRSGGGRDCGFRLHV